MEFCLPISPSEGSPSPSTEESSLNKQEPKQTVTVQLLLKSLGCGDTSQFVQIPISPGIWCIFSSGCSPLMMCLALHVSMCICWHAGAAEDVTCPFPVCR